MEYTIRTDNLVKVYKSRTVVNHVSISLKQGEIVGLLGPNGAGKTTSFYMIVGLIQPVSGEIFLNDDNITKFAMYKRAQMGISYLPQEASVFRDLSVEKNIKPIRWRAKENRNRALFGFRPQIYSFGRAICRCGPNCSRRYSEHHCQTEKEKYRHFNHRPQRPRNAGNYG